MRSGLSKVLHKICGKELVRHVVDSAKAAGYDRIVVIVSPPTTTRFTIFSATP